MSSTPPDRARSSHPDEGSAPTGSTESGSPGHDDSPALFVGKWWFWAPVLPLVALDLWTKSWAFSLVAEKAASHGVHPGMVEIPVWDAAVSFHLVHWMNTGTVWGLFQGFNSVLVGLRFVALGVLVYFAYRTFKRQWFQQLVLGFVLAGALGNLFDNLTQEAGGVRDFLLFFVGEGRDRTVFPAFNVADSCITVGAIALVFILWRGEASSS